LINPAPFFCGVLNARRKRNHQTHTARLGGFKKVLDKETFEMIQRETKPLAKKE